MATRFIAALLLSSIWAAPAVAQDVDTPALVQGVHLEVVPEGQHQELRLRDGSRLFGRVTRITDETVIFRTLAGAEVTIPRAEITFLEVVKGEVVGGEIRPVDANTTRLLFGPTGRSLKQGEGYIGVYEFMMPFVQVGVTDRISIGAGTPLVFGSGTSHPVWITPKVQFISTGRLDVSAGAMHFFNVDDATVGIAYTVMTYGTPDSAFTAGAGYAYEGNDDDYSAGSVVVMVGGERRLSRRTKLVTENYWFEGNDGIASLGLRFIGDRLSADLGLVVPITEDEFFAFPMVNFVWTF